MIRPEDGAPEGAGSNGQSKRMKSYRMVDFGAPLEAVEGGTPEPTGTQVLLRVRAAGVCHSDLHIWKAATTSASAAGCR
jgi:D-arabinose 1-dehydrogenase-like Zn-dependent alcohol dehydrogenase